MRRVLIGVSLILVLLAAPTVFPQETESGPDLAVTSIEVIGPEPVWIEDRPMNNTTIEIVVENRGDTEAVYTIEYAWRSDGETTPLNEREENSTDVSESPLDDGDRRRHRAPWYLQDRQVGQGQIIATVDAGDADTNEDNDQRSLPVFVERHALDLEIDQQPLGIPADGTRFFRAHAVNPGNVPENVSLSIFDPDEGPNARLNETLEPNQLRIDAEDNGATTVYTTWPFTGDSSGFSTNYTVQARATVSNGLRTVTMIRNATGPTVTNRTIENHSAYRQKFDLTAARGDTGTLYGDPNATVQTSIVLRNTGDRSDSYRFASHVSQGWAVHLDRNRSGLRSGDATMLTARIDAPDNATPGERAGLTFRACSDNLVPPTRQSCRGADTGSGVATVPIPVRFPGPVLDIEELSPAPTPTYIEDPLNLTVALHNPGNRPTPEDTNLTVRLTGPEGTDIERTRSLSPVDARDRRRVTLSFGEIDEPGRYVLEANWSSPDEELPPSDWTTEVRVRRPAANVTGPPGLAGGPGERIRYTLPPHTFQVTNEGNTTETFRVTVQTPSGQAVLLGDKRVTLAPGQNRAIPVAHHLPSPVGASHHVPLEVGVALVPRPAFSWSARTTTNVSDETPPSISLVGDYRSPWTITRPLEVRANVTDNGGLSSVVGLVEGPDGGSKTIGFEPSFPGQLWTASLRPTSPGNYSLRIRAEDMANHTTTVEAFEIEVRDIPPPEITIEGPANGSEVVRDETLTVVVRDDRPVQVLLRTVRDDGTTRTRPLHVSDGQAELSLSTFEPGTVRLRVRAVNDAGAQSVANRTLTIVEPASEAPQNETHEGRDSGSMLPVPSGGTVLTLAALVTSASIWASVASRRRRER